jgi:hypothetical protein
MGISKSHSYCFSFSYLNLYALLVRAFLLILTSQEGLLERQEFLQWILELLDKMRSSPSDDGVLKLLLPLALQYLDEFVQSELLARKLAYLCAKKLAQLCSIATDAAVTNALSSSPVLPPSASPQSPLLPGNM